MLIEQVRKLSPFDRLVYWIKEREAIRLKKEAGEAWSLTDDTILQAYKFCNVRRWDDRVSRWLWENWYKPEKDHPNILVAVVLARHLNLPATLVDVGFPFKWDGQRIKDVVRERQASGETAFNAAYMVRGIGTADKIEMVVDRVCQPLLDNPPALDRKSMQRSAGALLPYWGLSDFMAGQVVADLRWALTGGWYDKHAWASVGPGSARGLKRLYFGSVDAKVPAADLPGLLERATGEMKAAIPADIRDRLEAIDYQNCLCEYDKYSRALFGQGKPKQRYKGCE